MNRAKPLLRIDRHDAVVVLKLDRPERRNALSGAADAAELVQACAELNGDDGVRCVVLTGAGSAFSAGGDLAAMRDRAGPGGDPPLAHLDRYRRHVHAIVRAVHGLEMPLIAAVNGPAIGLGCDLACLADIRLAAEGTKFGVPFLTLGLIPGDGGAWLLPRAVGLSRASELLYTGETIDAPTAAAWGLVSRVVPADALLPEALALAERIAAQPAFALRTAKRLLRHGQVASLDALLEMSATAQAIGHTTQDHADRVAMLLAGRLA